MGSDLIIIYEMHLTKTVMINNKIQLAKYQLSQHKIQGVNSQLSIFEVAKLMDMVRIGDSGSASKSKSIFFSLN